ncbi:somatostatin receptor type 4-like [Glandiceps talaboti]
MDHLLNQTNEVPAIDEGYITVLPIWVIDRLIPTFSAVLCVIGLFGSGVVIFVRLRFPNMKSTTNTYILNLASADFLFFTDFPFLIYFNASNKWVFGNAICKLVMGIDGMYMFTGIFTLTAMAVDRYKAVLNTHIVRRKNDNNIFIARGICLTLWILSAIVTVPLWMYAVVEHDTSLSTTLCSILCPRNVAISFIVYAFTVGFLLPLGVITVCYVGIMVSLMQHRGLGRNRRSKIKIGRVSALILVAVIVFVTCWLPFWMVRFWLLFRPPSVAIETLYYCSLMLIYIKSCLNPFIYACFKDDFRKNMSCISCRGLTCK